MRTKLISVSKFSKEEKKKKEQKRLLLGCSGFFSSFGCCSEARVQDQALLLLSEVGLLLLSLERPRRSGSRRRHFALTFPQRAPAAASPQEAQRRPRADPRRGKSGCLGWQTLPGGELSAASAERPALVNLKGPRPFSGQDGLCFFPYLSSLSGNTFCCFFPLCLPAEGRR